MSESVTYIDLTPTYSESARTCAYMLAMHAGTRPENYLGGTYWDATERDEQIAVATMNAVMALADAFKLVGMDFYTQTATFKAKAIKNAYATVSKAL